jgi:hypothetical protein
MAAGGSTRAATLVAGSAILEPARRSVAVVAAGSAAGGVVLARVLDEPRAGDPRVPEVALTGHP